MNNDIKKILSHYEVQQRLPDYAFNRMTSEEKIIFENSINSYPDLMKELEEVRKVFHKVEHTNFYLKSDRRTRNLSVDVLNKLQTKKSRTTSQNISKYLVPTIGVFLIIILIWKGDFLFQNPNKSEQSSERNEVKDLINFKQSELSIILDTIVSEDDYILASENVTSSLAVDLTKPNSVENSTLAEAISDIYSEEVFYKYLDIIGDNLIKSELDYYHILNNIDNIEFNDLQLIIEELENVKIAS